MSAASKLAAMAKAAHSAAPAPAPAHVAFPKAAPAAAPKVAPVAAHAVAPKAAPPAANQCFEFRESGQPCSRNNCRDPACRRAKASAPAAASPKHSALAKSAGGGDGGVSAQISAMEARLTGHIDRKFQAAEASMTSGFLQQEQSFLELHQAVAQSQLVTQQSFQGLANAMATAISGGRRQLPPPERLQIGNIPQEIAEPRQQNPSYMHSCFVPNEVGSGRFAAPSSQPQQQSVAAYGGGEGQHMLQSSSYFPPPSIPSHESVSRHPTSGSGHSAHAPQSLAELMRMIPEFAKGFRGLCGRILSDADKPGAKPVPMFTFHKFVCAWQMSNENDDLACALMALTYGKPLSQQRLQPGIANALRTTNPTLFTEFFRRISAQYPSYVLTYNWKGLSGQECKTSYETFSSDSKFLNRFIHEHILA